MIWLIIPFLGLILIAILFEGAITDWGTWAFTRPVDGQFSGSQRASQVVWIGSGIYLAGLATYGLLLKT